MKSEEVDELRPWQLIRFFSLLIYTHQIANFWIEPARVDRTPVWDYNCGGSWVTPNHELSCAANLTWPGKAAVRGLWRGMEVERGHIDEAR
jgi:hypothetical protein